MNRVILNCNKEFIFQYCAKDKNWHLQKENNQQTFMSDKEDDLVAFLVLFYENPIDFFCRIKSAFPEQDQLNEAVMALPLTRLIKFCFENKLFYWIEHSLKWLSNISKDDTLIDLFNIVIKDKEYPQNIRHTLSKWINVFNKE